MMGAMDEPIAYLETPFLFPNKTMLTNQEGLGEAEHKIYAQICTDILDGQHAHEPPFLEFAGDFLKVYRRRPEEKKNALLNGPLAHAGRFSSWIAAGTEFLS
jgi:hypothetical protein